MKTIVVTGASGFLGSRIIRVAKTRGYNVIAATSNVDSIKLEGIKVLDKDYLISEGCDFNDVDIIINCAFPVRTKNINYYNGLEYIRRLAIKAEMSNIPYFVNISSQSVYDQKRGSAAGEDDELMLCDNYALGKYAVEKFLENICMKTKYTNIRLASLIGVGLDARIVNRFVASAIEGKKIRVLNGKQRFGYMDVIDAAEGIMCLCDSIEEIDLRDIYNLGIQNEYSLMEVAETVKKVGIEFGISNIEIECEESDLVANNTLLCDRLFSQILWRPSVSLEESVKLIYLDKQGT